VRRLVPIGVMAFAFALIAAPAWADTIYTTTLLGSNEVPPTGSAATGTAIVTLAGNFLDVSITFSGLGSLDTMAHIHCCAPVGTNASVAVPFTGFPLGVTSGTYTGVFDLTNAATYNSTFLSSVGGTAAAAEAALIAGLNSGMTYANVHSNVFPGGEIRGQLAAVPEPSTLILGMSMLAGIFLLKKKR